MAPIDTAAHPNGDDAAPLQQPAPGPAPPLEFPEIEGTLLGERFSQVYFRDIPGGHEYQTIATTLNAYPEDVYGPASIVKTTTTTTKKMVHEHFRDEPEAEADQHPPADANKNEDPIDPPRRMRFDEILACKRVRDIMLMPAFAPRPQTPLKRKRPSTARTTVVKRSRTSKGKKRVYVDSSDDETDHSLGLWPRRLFDDDDDMAGSSASNPIVIG